jgi:hypothetical protein
MMRRTTTGQEHRIDVDSGTDLRDHPEHASYGEMQAFWDRIKACGITRSKRRIAIMSMLATSWLPWGVRWDDEGDGLANLPSVGGNILCAVDTLWARMKLNSSWMPDY